MDKTAIKNYAIWARTKLIEDIKYKASLLGITEKGIADALPQSTTQDQYFDIGTREPYAIRGVQIAQRRSLAEAIKKKAQESDYLTAYNSIIEEVAYTWFNRFIAVRFMEVNDYLPCKIRVLSAVDGRQEPDIVQNPFDAKLDYTSAEEELISKHQMNNEGDKLFNMLFVKVCNDLSKVLPQLFEAEQDYTELLLNISYTDQDGLIYKLMHDIPEDNFDVNAVDEEGKPVGQVEIIGWLYQYYNTEPKNETFALLKKNVKITKERIPSATQLFTPDWIVRYMVENSLGRLVISGQLVVDSGQSLVDSEEERIAKEKELAERFGWKYYLPEAKQDADVREQLNQLTTNNSSLSTIAQAYQRWEEETNARFTQLKANEEELNRIFIDIYGLQDELTPEVEDKDVTVRKADLQRDIKSLLSYAVGCMFGRYSLDVEGLAYAGGEFSDQWVVISDQCYRREVIEKYVAQELQRAYGMAEVNVTDGRDLSFSEVIAERGVIFTFGSDEKSSSVDSIKYRRGTSKKLYEGICELSFNSERIKCGIGNATYDLCSPEILNAITSGSSVELVQRGWQDADSIDWQTIHYTLKTNHYGADEDNVIPITDEDYFEDDIIGRLIAWLKVVYGAETLEENLRFIADALGTSGDTARQKIRNYFLKDFFKDHCKIYQKRPIYWLYDSGKQNGFKALIYMHRYNADTSGQVRAEYLGKMEETYESEINRMQDIMDNGAGREVALAGKRKEKLQKQLHECRDYDAVLGHIALASIAIDLDDGVKVNYVKVQTAKDGKLLPILAKI